MERNPRSNLKHRPYTTPKGTGDSGYRYSTVDRRKSNMTRPKRPDTLQDLKSFLLAATTGGTKEGRATGRLKRPC